MAEQQASYRHWEGKSQTLITILGVLSGNLIALAGFYTSYVMSIQGQGDTAKVVVGGTLVALVTAFIYGTKSARNERLEQANSIAKSHKKSTYNK
jgi:uncharacterized membrane protein